MVRRSRSNNSSGSGSGGEDWLTKLPRNLLGVILEKAISSEPGEPPKGARGGSGGSSSGRDHGAAGGRSSARTAVRTLAALACTCRSLRDILFPESETVQCDFYGLEGHRQENHHCHLNSKDYPHSWYFNVEGYVCTDDMHALTLGGRLWHAACVQLLGEGICKVHTVCGAFTDDLCRENAIFWRNLCRDASDLTILHWSKGAHLVLKHNAKIEDGMMSKKMIRDPEIVKAQQLLNLSQTPRCSIPRPCKTCFSSSSTMLPFDVGGEAAASAGSSSAGGASTSGNRHATPEERAEAEKVLRAKWRSLASTFLLDKRLPRSGHCSASIGDFIVIVGGFCPANLPVVDVILIHIETMTIRCPEVRGAPPAKRFRQTLSHIEPSRESPLHPSAGEGRSKDHVLLMYGGMDALGCEYGGKEVNTLTVAADGAFVEWRMHSTTGQAPSPRYNHSADTIKEKKSLFVYGGEGEQVEGNDTCCYFLNLNSLLWRRVPTFANFKRGFQQKAHHPGARCLHTSAVRLNPKSGLEEVILFGGFSPAKDRFDSRQKNDIFDMSPYSLDLDTMQWTKHGCAPQVSKEGKESAANLQPKPRHRAASVKVTSDRLLVIGGISEQGLFLDDIVQLDLSTLEWREPPLVLGQPSHGLRHVAGCSAAGLFVFGGTTTTIFGVTPVTKLDVLQIGPPHELESKMLEEYKSVPSTPAGTPEASPRPTPKKKRGSISDMISDFVSKLKLGRGQYLEKFNIRQHQVLARHRASRHSFS